MILDDIIDYKKGFVAQSKQRVAPDLIRQQASKAAPTRDFCAGLRAANGIGLIAEIKKASPSKGLLAENFDPEALAFAYARGGAAAISCLTDEKFFQGSLMDFRAARAAVDLPMLRKEFVIDEYQIHEARAAGADAILLIASILDDATIRSFQATAQDYGMAALVEVHTEDEARRATDCGAQLVGVNNRDLKSKDFATDIRHTERLLPHLPKDAVKVGESGIRSPEDVTYLEGLGVDAILVGEQLVRQKDPLAEIARLLGARVAR